MFFAEKQKMKVQQLGRIENLSDVSSTLLFFRITSVDELDKVRELLKNKKKPGKVLIAFVFFPEYENLDVITDESVFFFNLNDFTLFAQMKESLRAKVQEVSTELLISFVQSPDPICRPIISEINAGFKVGVYQSNTESLFDLTLKTDINKIGIEQFYEEAIGYLDVLNIRKKS